MSRGTSLGTTNRWPRNADRAQWAASAVRRFAAATGLRSDLKADPQTVLVDLLTDLMHWCDAQRASCGLEESLDFESALGRARGHYRQEFVSEMSGLTEDPGQYAAR
jgi:hypothetical protein